MSVEQRLSEIERKLREVLTPNELTLLTSQPSNAVAVIADASDNKLKRMPFAFLSSLTDEERATLESALQAVDIEGKTDKGGTESTTKEVEDIANQILQSYNTDNPNKIQEGNHGGNQVTKSKTPNSPTRTHIEPNGHVDQGTVTKTDWMFDPFDDDKVNYRIVNLFTRNGKGSGHNGQNGISVFSAKAVGNHFGIFPSMNFGFSDDNPNGTPFKIMYFDTSDSEWRTPMMGAWREGRSIGIDEYLLSDGKLYKSLTTGITGETKPSHNTGVVSDGNINFQFIRDFIANASGIKPTIVIGDRDDMPLFGFPNVRGQIHKDLLFKHGAKSIYIGNDNVEQLSFGVDLNTKDYYVRNKFGGFIRISGSGKFIQSSGFSVLCLPKVINNNATIVNVEETELAQFNNTSPTAVTRLNGKLYQKIMVESFNENTTLVSGSNIITKSGNDIVLSPNDVRQFLMNSSGSIAREI